MVRNTIDVKDDSSGKKRSRAGTRKPGLPTPPVTLPVPRLREMPEVDERGWKRQPAELDPLLLAPEAEESVPAREKAAAPGGQNGSGAPRAAAPGASASGTAQSADLDFHMPAEDEELQLRYESALAELERLRGEAPRYDSRYDERIRELYEQIASREPFRYDSATDPLYQQYRQSYTDLGRMAMRDTMGQASGLTGGYGSSYAQSAGQQQYDAYLRRLADVLPETYGMALDAWQAEGQDLQRRYAAVTGLEKSDYDRYLDELGQYNRSLERARSDADAAYERMIDSDERAYRRASDDYERRLDADALAYQRAKSGAKSSSSGGRRRKTTQSGAAGGAKSAGDLKKGLSKRR